MRWTTAERVRIEGARGERRVPRAALVESLHRRRSVEVGGRKGWGVLVEFPLVELLPLSCFGDRLDLPLVRLRPLRRDPCRNRLRQLGGIDRPVHIAVLKDSAGGKSSARRERRRLRVCRVGRNRSSVLKLLLVVQRARFELERRCKLRVVRRLEERDGRAR